MICKSFVVSLFKTKVYVYTSPDSIAVARDITKQLSVDLIGKDDCEAYAVSVPRKTAIWVPESVSEGVVVHECYHAAIGVVRELGGSGEDEELMAHLIQFIYERVSKIHEHSKIKNNA